MIPLLKKNPKITITSAVIAVILISIIAFFIILLFKKNTVNYYITRLDGKNNNSEIETFIKNEPANTKKTLVAQGLGYYTDGGTTKPSIFGKVQSFSNSKVEIYHKGRVFEVYLFDKVLFYNYVTGGGNEISPTQFKEYVKKGNSILLKSLSIKEGKIYSGEIALIHL